MRHIIGVMLFMFVAVTTNANSEIEHCAIDSIVNYLKLCDVDIGYGTVQAQFPSLSQDQDYSFADIISVFQSLLNKKFYPVNITFSNLKKLQAPVIAHSELEKNSHFSILNFENGKMTESSHTYSQEISEEKWYCQFSGVVLIEEKYLSQLKKIKSITLQRNQEPELMLIDCGVDLINLLPLENRNFSIPIKNLGDKVIKIERINSESGCTTCKNDEQLIKFDNTNFVIQPHSTFFLNGAFNNRSHSNNPNYYKILFKTSTPKRPFFCIHIRTSFKSPVEITPQYIWLGNIKAFKPKKIVISLSNWYKKGIKIRNVALNKSNVSLEYNMASNTKNSQLINVNFTEGFPAGPIIYKLLINTTCIEYPTITIPLKGYSLEAENQFTSN